MESYFSKGICVKANAMALIGILTQYINPTFHSDNHYTICIYSHIYVYEREKEKQQAPEKKSHKNKINKIGVLWKKNPKKQITRNKTDFSAVGWHELKKS